MTQGSAASISAVGMARVALKVAAMLAVLIAILPPLYFCRLFRIANPWPRRTMAAVIWIMGIDLRISGQRAQGNEFLVANHVSWIDIAAISAATGAAFVANDGLGIHPVTRWMCKMNGAILIARHDRTSVQFQIEQVREAMTTVGTLVIFPEGTTSDGTELLPFKSSLLSALDPLPDGVAVQPVLLDYGADAASNAWIGDESGFDNFKRLLAQSKPIELTVHFLSPLRGEALANRKTISAAARAAILERLTAQQVHRVTL
jgi:lyso-ornithine lipid O-acyltransferase